MINDSGEGPSGVDLAGAFAPLAHFPRLCFVKVNNARYHGYGMVEGASEQAPKLAVLLPNGNTWWYEMDTCEVIKDLKQVPQEMRRIKMRYRGLKVMVSYGPCRKLP